MKLKSKKSTEFIIIFLTIVILTYINKEILNKIDKYNILPIVIPILAYIIYLIIHNNYQKKIKQQGIKKRGYIYRYNIYTTRKSHEHIYVLDYILEGKTYSIKNIRNDKATKMLCNKLENYTSKNNKEDIYELQTFPIDVYEYKNKLYPDIESIQISENKE